MVTKTKKTTTNASKSKISLESTKKSASKKKTTHKKAKIIYEEPSKKKDYFFPILLIILAVVIIGFVSNGSFFLNSPQKPIEEKITTGNQDLLVSVNGDNIYQGELDEYWNRLPPQIKLQLNKEDLLEEFIQERLLLQEANNNRIKIGENEVDNYIATQLSASNITLDQFKQILTQQGTTFDQMRSIYERQLKLAKLFEGREQNDLSSSEEEIKVYYKEHKKEFFSPEQVTIRHLLIPVNDNLNDSDAQERAILLEGLLDEANNSNFCELVTNFSADPGSINNCGEYTFAKGEMVKEFEDAGFNMSIGERRTVKTSFGYHIMLKDNAISAGYYALNDTIGTQSVSSAIERILAEGKAKDVYNTYITELKANSQIVFTNSTNEIEKNTIVELGDDIAVKVQ